MKKKNDEITIRSSAADRQMLLSAAVLFLLSYLHIDASVYLFESDFAVQLIRNAVSFGF